MDSDNQYVPVMVDDTIDLRPYLLGLGKFWPFLVGLPIIVALLVLAVKLSGPPQYETRVRVAILTYRTDFALEPTMRTETNEGAMREALADLAENSAIAEEVIQRLGDNLPEDCRDVAALVEMVSAEARESDLIEITVRAPEPDVAQMVAEAWAAAYEDHINDVYSGIAPGAIEATEEQARVARAEYEAAQQALADFTGENPSAELSRLIAEKQSVLDALKDARVREITQVANRRLEVERFLENVNSLSSISEAAGQASSESNALAGLLLKAQAYAYASSSLPGSVTLQLAPGSSGERQTTDQQRDLPMMLLEAQRYASSSLPASLTLELPQDLLAGQDAASQQRDLEAFAKALEAELGQREEELADYLAGTSQPEGEESSFSEGIAMLEGELRSLQAELETATARDQELRQARDLAWETYTALTRKTAEQRVESALTRNVVRVASAPLRPEKPASRGALQTVALAGLGTFVVAILVAFLIMYLFPDFDPSVLWRSANRRVQGTTGDDDQAGSEGTL